MNVSRYPAIIAVLAMTISWLAWSSDLNAQSWEAAKDEKGVNVMLRKVEGYSIKEFRGTTTMKTSVDHLVALFMDTERCTAWEPECKTSHIVETINATEFILYVRMHMQWPAKDRDYVLQIKKTVDEDSGQVTMAFEDVQNVGPADGCCVRMERYRGFWRFTPASGGKVEVTFQNHFHPGGNFPASLVNSALADWPLETLSKLKVVVESGV